MVHGEGGDLKVKESQQENAEQDGDEDQQSSQSTGPFLLRDGIHPRARSDGEVALPRLRGRDQHSARQTSVEGAADAKMEPE